MNGPLFIDPVGLHWIEDDSEHSDLCAHGGVVIRRGEEVLLDDSQEKWALGPAMLEKDSAQISEWREAGGQSFLHEDGLREEVTRLGLELTPRLGSVEALPASVEEAAAFLDARIPESLSRLDDAGGGQPEGIVARSLDRRVIAKLRFEDYRRTLKRRKKK